MVGVPVSQNRDGGLNASELREREENRLCGKEHRHSWRVVQRNGNASAFNGYRWTWSRYSGVRCLRCLRFWRTGAATCATWPTLRPRRAGPLRRASRSTLICCLTLVKPPSKLAS